MAGKLLNGSDISCCQLVGDFYVVAPRCMTRHVHPALDSSQPGKLLQSPTDDRIEASKCRVPVGRRARFTHETHLSFCLAPAPLLDILARKHPAAPFLGRAPCREQPLKFVGNRRRVSADALLLVGWLD